MAKYTLRKIEAEEDFIEAFGKEPRWIFSANPQAKKSRTGKRNPDASEYNNKDHSIREAENRTGSLVQKEEN